MSLFRSTAIALALSALVLGAAACSSSDSEADATTTTTTITTTTAASGESAATVRFDKTIQQELADVGCDPGEIDGTFGPETDAAIVRLQTAAGLPADGQFGPKTAAALTKAVDAGDAVCTTSASTTTTSKTTTTTAGGAAPCTATAIVDGLGGDPATTVTSYVCAGGYAAGTVGGTDKFILKDVDGGWNPMDQDPCGSASAGLPPIILEDGCPA